MQYEKTTSNCNFNNNNITSLSDVLMFIPTFDSVDGQPKYNFRFDLNMDGKNLNYGNLMKTS